MVETTQPQVAQPNNQSDIQSEGGQTASQVDADISSDQSSQPFMTVRYNKEDKSLDREAAKTYAQKGMNYDKLQERLEAANQKLSEYESKNLFAKPDEYAKNDTQYQSGAMDTVRQYQAMGMDENTAKQTVVDSQLARFIKTNPNVDPRQLPESVLSEWKSGVPLGEAYYSHQTQGLQSQADALRQQLAVRNTNTVNAKASMGAAHGEGASHAKPLSGDVIRTMSKKELDRNHGRIWAYLTGTK